MKNLENVAGLQEMSQQEMKDVNGGIFLGLGLLAAGIIVTRFLAKAIGDFAAGWYAAS